MYVYVYKRDVDKDILKLTYEYFPQGPKPVCGKSSWSFS